MNRSPALLAKRVIQTPRLVRNFPGVYAALLAGDTRWAPRELRFRMRNGLTVVGPNVPGARYPVFEIFADDAYRFAELAASLPESPRVLDIGGQLGCFSLGLARQAPRAVIHTYEASPVSAGYIRRNIDTNGFGDRVTVHATALAAEEGTLSFRDSGTASGLNGLSAPEGHTTTIEVPATTFDNAVAGLDGKVDLVKMDIEGGEYDAILTSSPSSWSTVQRVVMEYHPIPGHTQAELVEFLGNTGLHVVHDEPGTEPGLGVMWLERKAA